MKQIILTGFAILCFAGCSKKAEESAAGKGAENSAAQTSRVKREAGGEVTITLDKETQNRMGLKVAALTSAQLQPERKGYGRVLDPAPLAALVNELVAAHVAAQASKQDFDRLKLLADQNNASVRALQMAEATARRDQLLAQSLGTRLTLTWSKALAGRDDLPDFVQSLVARENALIRIDLPAGDSLLASPLSARIVSLANEAGPVPAEFFDVAPAIDAQTQGQGFLFFVKGKAPGLAPNAAVTGFLKIPGEAVTGAAVPSSAVVRHEGAGWVFVESQGTNFTRRLISLEHLVGNGWFVTNGVAAGDSVVVTGAQTVFSEELNAAGSLSAERN